MPDIRTHQDRRPGTRRPRHRHADGIGALLVYRPDDSVGPAVEDRFPVPPALLVRKAAHLAPLRHALAQTDGAAVFDAEGVLRRLGVRLVPSPDAESEVDALGGTRHTSGSDTATTIRPPRSSW